MMQASIGTDIDVLSEAGINWVILMILSDAGINWEDIDDLK